MMKNILFLTILLFSLNYVTNGQSKDSLRTKKILKKSILPTVFIGTGILLNNSSFEKDFNKNIRNKVGNDFSFPIDDYIQYLPIAEMYIADIAGVKGKNHWFNQTKYLFISNLITTGLVQGTKYLTKKTRPNGSPYSFPSGHTTFAFTNATVLYNEFHESSPMLAYSGYAFSTTTGIFRMVNNKHWLSDVLVGAGTGVIVANLVYYFEPLKSFNPFKKKENITLIPQINEKTYGLYFSYNF